MKVKILFILVLFGLFPFTAYSEEIYFKNGDKITGEVVEESEESISINTEAMGIISVNRDFVERIIMAKEEIPVKAIEEAKKPIWQREVSFGYNKSSGNTQNSQLTISMLGSRKRESVDELTLKANTFYSSASQKMDSQKYYGTARYAFSFGEGKKWYNFYKLDADHDRFANIDYRFLPSIGVGYWWYDLPEIKAMAEVGIGLEHTDFRDGIKDTDEIVIIPRGFFEKTLLETAIFSQDVYLYPTFEDFSEYRLHSETTLTSPLTGKYSLRLSIIDDYDSNPIGETKKNDLRFMSSLVYSF